MTGCCLISVSYLFFQEKEIDSSGKRDLLIKRLKQFYKAKLLKEAGLVDNTTVR